MWVQSHMYQDPVRCPRCGQDFGQQSIARDSIIGKRPDVGPHDGLRGTDFDHFPPFRKSQIQWSVITTVVVVGVFCPVVLVNVGTQSQVGSSNAESTHFPLIVHSTMTVFGKGIGRSIRHKFHWFFQHVQGYSQCGKQSFQYTLQGRKLFDTFS